MKELLSRRLVLVTGKGGVGRTCVTAALALVAQRAGARPLVVETTDGGNDYSALAELFGRRQLPRTAEELAPGILGSQLLTSTGVELFLTSVLRVPALARTAASFEPIRRLLSAAPSFREMGMFFHLLTYLRAKDAKGAFVHGPILVDMPATGHTLALATLPETLLRMVSRGPVAEGLREGQAILQDPGSTGVYTVTLPETLPISEALELMEALRKAKVTPTGVMVNRVPRDVFNPGERAALLPFLREHELLGADGFARILETQARVQRLFSATEVPSLCLPELECHGRDVVEGLAAELASAQFSSSAGNEVAP